MLRINLIFLFGALCALPVMADSFLSAKSFPTQNSDMSFSEKMNFKAQDYELYRPVYDKDGFCIRGCAYPGINIAQEKVISDEDTRNALKKSLAYQQRQATVSVDTRNILGAVRCANRNPYIPVNQKNPWSEPLIGQPLITSPYGERMLEGERSFHDGIDYRASIGTTVYAPADGVVVNVLYDSRCGKGLKIQHEDGTKTIYCHLSKSLVNQGDNIGAGCPIAETGNTGHTTGPHLHYGIQNEEGRKINPVEYTRRAS